MNDSILYTIISYYQGYSTNYLEILKQIKCINNDYEYIQIINKSKNILSKSNLITYVIPLLNIAEINKYYYNFIKNKCKSIWINHYMSLFSTKNGTSYNHIGDVTNIKCKGYTHNNKCINPMHHCDNKLEKNIWKKIYKKYKIMMKKELDFNEIHNKKLNELYILKKNIEEQIHKLERKKYLILNNKK